MPDRIAADFLETASQVRSLLQGLDDWGIELFDSPEPSPQDRQVSSLPAQGEGESLEAIRVEFDSGLRCRSCAGQGGLLGSGNPNARMLFVKKDLTSQEQAERSLFVGEEGLLLDKILYAMGFSRPQVYLCPLVKCVVEGEVSEERIESCRSFFDRQLRAVNPEVLVVFGEDTADVLLGQPSSSRHLSRWSLYQGYPLMTTFSPDHLLAHPSDKKETWEDLKQVLARIRQG